MKRNTDATIEGYVSGSEAVLLRPAPRPHSNPRLREDERVFSFETYAREIHPPVAVLAADLRPFEEAELPRCLDLPLRLAGTEDYHLPREWEALAPLLGELIAVEHEHNPSWRDYFTYLTVDYSTVTAGYQQRHGGLHVDGFQGARISEKTKVTRNYVATSNGGTVFYPQRFVCADPEKFNVFLGFELQADTSLVAEENTVYFMDAYTVHESGFAARDGVRLFLRLTYDLKKFDRRGNSHNSALSYSWEMVERSVASEVEAPRLTDVLASPHFPNP